MKHNRLILLALCLLALTALLVGCGKEKATTAAATTPSATTPAVITAPAPTTTTTQNDLFQVNFTTGTGTAIPVQLLTRGQTVTPPADPVRAGYDFAGWTLYGQPYDFTAPVTSNLVLVATWVEKICDMTFVDLEGEELLTVSLPYGVGVDAPTPDLSSLADNELVEGWISDEGVVFDGFAREDGIYRPRKIPAVTLYFWDEYGEEPLYAFKLKAGEKLGAPPSALDKTSERKEFVEWITTTGASYVPGRAYSATVSFYAVYQQKFAVEFYCGSTLKKTLLVEDGGYALTPPTPDAAEEGYAFSGWYTEQGEKWSASLPIVEDMVFRAEYKPTHTVTFMLNGSTFSTVSVADGGTVPFPVDPQGKVFYTFSPANALYNVTEDRTVELTAVSYSTCLRYTYGMTNQDSGYFQNVKTNGYVAKYATVLYEVGHYFTLTGNMYGPITGWINQDRLEPGMSVEFDVILDGEVVNHVVLTSTYNAKAHPIMCMVPTSGEHTLTIRVTAMNGIYEFNQWGSNMLCSVLYCYLPR